jgi:MFS family permease
MVADTLPPDKMGQGIGIYWMAQAFAQAIGASLGLELVAKVGYKGTFLIAGAMAALAILLATRIQLNFKRTKEFKISLQGIAAGLPASVFSWCMAIPQCRQWIRGWVASSRRLYLGQDRRPARTRIQKRCSYCLENKL